MTMLALLTAWTFHASARAQGPIDLGELPGGIRITPQAQMFRDASGQSSYEMVSTPEFEPHWQATGGELSLGLERAPLWLKWQVANHSEKQKSWFLELGYPHLDRVTLFIAHADGLVERLDTGDMLPFSARQVAQPNFIFPMETKAGETVSLYLRVATTGTVSLPLTAWDATEFLEMQGRTLAVLWTFFGALIMMAFYNAAVFLLIRQVEYLTQSVLLLAMCACTFTFNGLMFQYVLPNQPGLANKAIGLSLMFAISAGMLTCSQVTARIQGYEAYELGFRRAAWIGIGCTTTIALTPKEFGLRLAVLGTIAGALGGAVALIMVTRRNHPQLRLYLLSWYFPLFGVPITLFVNLGILPPVPILAWAAYIGCAMQAVFTSLALAARVKVMGDHLAGLNTQLSSNVQSLSDALVSAKDANDAALRATRAKDEFLATMSHELRTPLNAIINVPQGLLDDFEDQRGARCAECSTDFLLEADDRVDAQTECEECHARGSLVLGKHTVYTGEPAHTARFLRKIERAGHHLLHMVDGVLDFSKMEVGRLELYLAELDLGALVNDVVDAMSEPARQKGLAIAVTLPSTSLLRKADPVRMKQVLLNLLSNAIKFSSQAGDIEVRVSFDAATDSDIIEVRDRGIGIAAEHHERIFAGFEQVHAGSNRSYGGTGLGLPISRSLVRLHGGELSVRSALGQGAAFMVSLPRRPAHRNTAYPATTSLYPSWAEH